MKSIYFLGLGALGAKYAASFYEYNPEIVSVIVDEERKNRYEKSQIFVNDKAYDFNYVTKIEENNYPDYIFLVVKSSHLQQAIEDMKPFVGENTMIVSLMNGISSERVLADHFGWDRVVNAVAYMDAVKVDNRVTFSSIGKIIFGKMDSINHHKLVDLHELMNVAEIPNQLSDDIQKAQWAKYLVNVVGNQLTFLLEFPYGQFRTNQHLEVLMDMISNEVLAVGNAHGVAIGQEEVDRMKSTMKIVDEFGKTSMLQDREAKRYSEVDEFAGEIISLGKQYNIPTPYNEFIYNMVKSIEETY
ncbi:ketopantoate reductase family protein [Empedobacter sp. GD03739]|uniref:ketopantoate reductase family protein n=1 Tax=Empedobacter sp. GD03739 TaxID=2975376 RepID=UPI002449A4E6|nr:ketopantoate reductase family protein [Empedobacter sp. GD03739]MDH1602826.1 ketopantoate reductase family protein [Empedobacter sp. GD03739]